MQNQGSRPACELLFCIQFETESRLPSSMGASILYSIGYKGKATIPHVSLYLVLISIQNEGSHPAGGPLCCIHFSTERGLSSSMGASIWYSIEYKPRRRSTMGASIWYSIQYRTRAPPTALHNWGFSKTKLA